MGRPRGTSAGPERAQSFEYRVIAADGRVVWVRDDVWVVRDANGEHLSTSRAS